MQCKISISPAEKTTHGHSHILCDKREVVTPFEFKAVSDVIAEIRRLAQTSGHETVTCYAHLPRGERKPRGWDAALKTVQYIDAAPVHEPLSEDDLGDDPLGDWHGENR